MSADPPSRRSLRLAGEFAVIVIGVFIAVAAESWWSEREDRAYERELREDMVEEFEANLRILESDLAANDTARARLGSFTERDDGELLAMSSAEVTAAIGGWLQWAGFDPYLGAAQALVESGNLGVIGDRRLRLLLSQWAGLLEEKRRFNSQAVDFQIHRVTPRITMASADLEWTAAERREAQALLRGMAVLQESTVQNQRRLQAAAEDILAHLRD